MATDRMVVRPVSGACGAEIEGVDLAAPLPEATVARIRAALLEHHVVFFRAQSLAPQALLAFASRFGRLSRYPFVAGMPGYPDIVEVVKREDETANFGGIWHSDTTYLERPPLGSVLYARVLPPAGGDTLFANMVLAYEALSPGMRRLLDPLVAVNRSDKADAARGRERRRSERPGRRRRLDLVAEHPAVRTHPETGRRALFVNRGHTVGFRGLSEAESRPLLEFLFRHQVRPEFTCRFRWTPGALAFWDNRSAQHYAVNDYHGHRRVMHRVTIEGDRPR